MEIARINWPVLFLSLQQNVTYIQYGMLDRTIRNFWTVFHKLPEEKKKMFLGNISGILNSS